MTQEKNYMISIVVPFYNIPDEYFIPFVESIKSQTYQNYEVIIVNDGSTNVTSEHLNDVVGDDSRFKIVEKVNGGVSSAKNEGIQRARGDLLFFMDPDDKLYTDNALEIIAHRFEKRVDLDLLVFGYAQLDRKGCYSYVSIKNQLEFDGMQAVSFLGTRNKYVTGYTWNKVFNLQKLKNHMVPFDTSLSSYEDKLWLFQTMLKLESCIIIPDILYQYNYNSNSLSRTVDSSKIVKKYDDAFEAYKKILECISTEYPENITVYYSILVDEFCISLNNILHKRYFVADSQEFFISKYSNFLHSTWKKIPNKKYFFLIKKIFRYIKG